MKTWINKILHDENIIGTFLTFKIIQCFHSADVVCALKGSWITRLLSKLPLITESCASCDSDSQIKLGPLNEVTSLVVI